MGIPFARIRFIFELLDLKIDVQIDELLKASSEEAFRIIVNIAYKILHHYTIRLR